MASHLNYNCLALGFHLPDVDITTLSAAALLKSSDPWEHFLGILVSCTQGNFSNLPQLGPLLRKDDSYLFCVACCNLMACAGTWDMVRDFCEEIESEAGSNASSMIESVSVTLGLSCDLRAIPHLLRLYDLSETDDDRVSVEQAITYLLADGPFSHIGTGCMSYESEDHLADREDVKQRVNLLYSEVREKTGIDRPILYGKPFDVVEIATILQQLLAENSGFNGADKSYPCEKLFEAATGINFSLIWNSPAQRKLMIGGTERILNVSHNYPAACAIIESFLQSKGLHRYQPGQRYFFGHLIE